jgi:hypothetical protein
VRAADSACSSRTAKLKAQDSVINTAFPTCQNRAPWRWWQLAFSGFSSGEGLQAGIGS